jgi:hypothetical protein
MKRQHGAPNRRFAQHRAFRAQVLALALGGTVTAAAACGGHKASGSAPNAEPVAECLQYQSLMQRCLHRDVPMTQNMMQLVKTDADRERFRAVCSENLERLSAACR